jgi:hypothetical protein
MAEMYLTKWMLQAICWMRQCTVSEQLAEHLIDMFGEDGKVAQIRSRQEAEMTACPRANTRHCGCGNCAPYRDGPLLDEVLTEVQAFERGALIFNERGEAVEPEPVEMPF